MKAILFFRVNGIFNLKKKRIIKNFGCNLKADMMFFDVESVFLVIPFTRIVFTIYGHTCNIIYIYIEVNIKKYFKSGSDTLEYIGHKQA